MFYLSKGLYGNRGFKHFDLYAQQPGWWFMEMGSWTLEVTTTWQSFRETFVTLRAANLVVLAINIFLLTR